MGYDLHITRAEEWTESESAPIALAEWKNYIACNSDFRLDGFAEATTPNGETIRYENEGLAVWSGYSKASTNGHGVWFDYHRGRIVVKNPDDEVVAKMKEIAGDFWARVVGDDGEEY